jgi:signal transduction histidine kinase
MPIKSFRKSFGFKIFRSFALSILVMAIVLSALLVYYQNSMVKRDLYKEGTMLADMLAYSIRTWVFAENRDMLKDAVQGVMGQKNVVAVVVYNADKQVLIIERKQSADRKDLLGMDPAADGKIQMDQAGIVPKTAEGEGTIGFLSPVVLETYKNMEEAIYFEGSPKQGVRHPIGYVEVILDKGVLRTEMRSILIRNAVATLLFLLSGSLAIYIAVRRLMRPLTNLAVSVRSLGKGETVEKVSVESMDEIGRLAMDFNTMSDNLKKREAEKESLEEKLRYAQKMEAVGTLARGIAHDFNNILATLRGSIYLIDKKLPEHDDLRQYTQQVHGSIARAQNLVRGLLTFSRTQRISFRPTDLGGIIRRLQPMLASMAGEGTDLKVSLPGRPVMVMSDSVQMEQILMNLCANGRDAMPDGGTLSVLVELVTVGPEAGSQYPPEPGRYALISVSDTGPGMDEKTRGRIFEPYFTTKDVGKGTGLGLAIVYGIVKQHKGWIWVDSAKGEGTTFRVYLPLFEKSAEDMGNKMGQIATPWGR